MSSNNTAAAARDFRLWESHKTLPTSQLLDLLNDVAKPVRYSAARELHIRGGEAAFKAGLDLCRSPSINLREVGAFLLGQIGTPKKPYAKASEAILLDLLKDRNRLVRASAVAALGHIAGSRSITSLLQCIHDRSIEVRQAAAFSLGEFSDYRSKDALLFLTKDSSERVREWAVVGLSKTSGDDPVVSRRLTDLLNDESGDVRAEAEAALEFKKHGAE